jgi:Cation efflux family
MMHHEDSGHNEHSHGAHGHAHAPKSFGPAFATATALNLGLVLAELVFGFLSNSLALISDGVHNFSDALGLLSTSRISDQLPHRITTAMAMLTAGSSHSQPVQPIRLHFGRARQRGAVVRCYRARAQKSMTGSWRTPRTRWNIASAFIMRQFRLKLVMANAASHRPTLCDLTAPSKP